MRDEMIDAIQNKKKEVTLGLQIGHLVLSPTNTVQFKSLSFADVQT